MLSVLINARESGDHYDLTKTKKWSTIKSFIDFGCSKLDELFLCNDADEENILNTLYIIIPSTRGVIDTDDLVNIVRSYYKKWKKAE